MKWSLTTAQSGRTVVRVRHGRWSYDLVRTNWRKWGKR